jgi:serine/threonine-protein kinase
VSRQLVATRYELGDRLGAGGVAVVYRAHDVRLDRPCALKILRDQYAQDPAFLRRFEREARTAAGLNHPNLVAVYDYGPVGDSFFIAMEYVGGGSLKDEIQRHGPLNPREAVRIASEVLSALSVAHANGLVHRDVKPQNVMLTADRTAKLADFGIAHAPATTQLTQMGVTLGTAAYVAPEQAQGAVAGPPADIYGVGLLLYEMLTGRPAFEGDSVPAIVYRQVHEVPPAPGQRVSGATPALDAVVMRALEKDPTRRFPSAEAMLAALSDPAVLGEWGTPRTTVLTPVTASRRRGGWLLLPALVAAALLMGLGYLWTSYGQPVAATAVPTSAPTNAPLAASTNAPTVAPAEASLAAPTPALTTAPSPPPQPTPVAKPSPSAASPTSVLRASATTPPPSTATAPPRPTSPAAPASSGSIGLEDTAFAGGYRNPGSSIYRQRTATWVYAANTPFSTMTATVDLPAAPAGPATLTVVGLSSEHSQPRMALVVNGTQLHRGPAPFASDTLSQDFENAAAPWTEHSWTVPPGVLHAGRNSIAISNLEPSGGVNQPPFVMVDQARLDLSA